MSYGCIHLKYLGLGFGAEYIRMNSDINDGKYLIQLILAYG